MEGDLVWVGVEETEEREVEDGRSIAKDGWRRLFTGAGWLVVEEGGGGG